MSIQESVDQKKRLAGVTQSGAAVSPSREPLPAAPEHFESRPKVHTPRENFLFAVKLFGSAAVVLFLIWLMNRAVS